MLNRVVGGISRRIGRPELLALVSAQARQAQHEAQGMSVVLASLLGPSSTYVDVGANRGQVLRDAVRVAPNGRHVAFEPIPELAAAVRRAFPDVECREFAIGARAESARFCHFTNLDGWSGLRRQPSISDERGRPTYIDVQVSTLDEQIPDLDPAVIKIDVEGAELAVLEGARGVIGRSRPRIILEHVEESSLLYDASSADVFDIVADLGYRVFTLDGDGPVARGRFVADAVTVNWLLSAG